MEYIMLIECMLANQSTSYIMSSTASVMPIVDTIEVREYGDSTTFYPDALFDK